MASDAGRVIPLPKGAWDISRNYEVLDIVNHKNQSWMAKLPSIGIEPTEGQFWTMYGSSVQKASTDAMGIVKIPSDGSMTIDADGTIGVTVDDALDKTSDMPIANSAVAEAIESVTTSIDGKLTPSVVSDAYNPDKTYAVGEYCIYNDVLWKCKVLSKGVAPAEGATWDKCSVSGEISSLNNVLANNGVIYETYTKLVNTLSSGVGALVCQLDYVPKGKYIAFVYFYSETLDGEGYLGVNVWTAASARMKYDYLMPGYKRANTMHTVQITADYDSVRVSMENWTLAELNVHTISLELIKIA